MSGKLHLDVFSWPPVEAFEKGSSVQPEDLGTELVEEDILAEFKSMIRRSKEEKKDEPFCVFDVGNVIRRYRLWKKAFPMIRPFFAIKCYDDPVVIKLLSQLGAGFDCASKEEIVLIQELHVDPEDIVFANPIKIPSHISYAAEMGVSLMTFDSYDELVKIKEHYPHARICPIEDENATAKFGGTFGCYEDEVAFLLTSSNQMGLHVVGVAFHIGSGCTRPDFYVKNIELAKQVFDIASEEGIQMNILDIGGGFSGRKETESAFLQMNGPINACIKRLFSNIPGMKIMAEPGRFFVEAALTLATSIIGRRTRKAGTEKQVEYILSTSAYGFLNRSIAMSGFEEGTYYPSLAIREPTSACKKTYIFRGPSVSPADTIQCSNLPELEVGDWLVFENVGAYSVSLSATFNGFKRTPIRRLMQKKIWESLMNGSF